MSFRSMLVMRPSPSRPNPLLLPEQYRRFLPWRRTLLWHHLPRRKQTGGLLLVKEPLLCLLQELPLHLLLVTRGTAVYHLQCRVPPQRRHQLKVDHHLLHHLEL